MLLVAINSFIGNWGFSIIILTVLLKLLLWPISAAGYRSMAKMRVVQPKLQEIQSRYKDDRQKLGVEMMALYRKEKINPAGGCFPMLVQIPVFIALFFALREVVELRHAPFLLWVQDLSVPDPLFIMPFLMAGLMYLTQQLNPTPQHGSCSNAGYEDNACGYICYFYLVAVKPCFVLCCKCGILVGSTKNDVQQVWGFRL